jgi:glycosyltransferase involved in cell wall biosynthesis
VALYRDLLVSTLWKTYRFFKPLEVFYHYHTKGINEYVSASERNLKLTRFFVKDVNLVLLSPLLEKDFEKVKTYRKVYFLPNGVEDPLENEDLEAYISKKYAEVETVDALYLAHMMKEKGYWEVLELAKATKEQKIRYHFAGSWKEVESEVEFFTFVKEHGLEEQVVYHGFVSGEQKDTLFRKAHLLLYPSKNDAFPLTLLESLSYCVPVIATDEGSIPYILDGKSGIVLHDVNDLSKALEEAKEHFVNEEIAQYCRKRYLENFSLEQFEENLVELLGSSDRGK